MNINVSWFCSVDQAQIKGFGSLLQELIALLSAEDDISCLEEVFVVEDGQVANTVNSIIQSVDPDAMYVPGENYVAEAAAVPVERNNELACFVVINCKLVHPLSAEYYHPPGTVSALLEELLHSQFYNSLWRLRGYVQPRYDCEMNPCKARLMPLAYHMCDEYFAMRKKAFIVNTVPLIDAEAANGLMTGQIQYGGNVIESLKNGFGKLNGFVEENIGQTKDVFPIWDELSQVLYRDIFEPLSRNAACVDGLGDEISATSELELYGEGLTNYWFAIHDQLRRAFESDLDDIETTISKIVDNILSFLTILGISCQESEGGLWQASFTSGNSATN